MGILDGVMNVFKLGNDDEYDEYDEYDEVEDDDFEYDNSSKRKSIFSGMSKKNDDIDEDEDIESSVSPKLPAKNSKKVVPIKPTGSRGLELVVIKPTSIEEAKEITNTLLSGKAVVLNLDGMNVDIAQRIIDYSAGSCYAMRGNLQKITSYIFLVTPPNVDISGDIPELVAGGIDLSTFGSGIQQ